MLRVMVSGDGQTASGVLEDLVAAATSRVLGAIRETAVYIPQRNSPLGRNRHIRAVRRRIAAGQDGACKIGKTYMLTPLALAEEMRRFGTDAEPSTVVKPKAPKPVPEFAEIDAEIERVLEACR